MAVEPGGADLRTFPGALREAVAVADVRGGERGNPLGHSTVSNEELEAAVRQSLRSQGLLAPDGAKAPFRLRVFLAELNQPASGLGMTVVSVIRYRIVRVSDRAVPFEEVVVASYTAKAEDSGAGVERLQLANEGSVRRNIADFLDRLAGFDPAGGKP
ncbi:MAG TPA: hypothetical protein VMT17_00875 [Anaeromyxobacteraceae bacterium]|nr:hypothetical protein [Anaeromyxobacteraceae bacterium]